jgi:hypothetical protein
MDRSFVDVYEAPEVLELGAAEEMTLGGEGCCTDCCGCKKGCCDGDLSLE